MKKLFLGLRLERFYTEPFGYEPLQRAYRNGCVDPATAAPVFARRCANTPTYGGKRIRRSCSEVRFLVPAIGNQPDIAAGIGVNGAGSLTWNHVHPELHVRNNRAVCWPSFRLHHESVSELQSDYELRKRARM
jgi:hypothetical protein